MSDMISRLRDTLAILDVGHGNSAVLFADDDVGIFDTGTGSGLLEFLEEQGVTHIKSVFLSHADKDHIGGLMGLLSSSDMKIDRVVVNSDGLQKSVIWDDLLFVLNSRHMSGATRLDTKMTAGDREVFGYITACVQAPSPYLAGRGPGSTDSRGRRITSNSISSVVRICSDEGPIAVLAGDLDAVGLDDFLDGGGGSWAPVLVFPHHGGKPGNADISRFVGSLLKVVQPRLIVFSIGRGVGHNPSPEVVACIRKFGGDVRIICTQLSRHCAKSLDGVSENHLSSVFARGRADGSCCGGTVLIPLRGTGSVVPDTEQHGLFIRSSAESALCMRS